MVDQTPGNTASSSQYTPPSGALSTLVGGIQITEYTYREQRKLEVFEEYLPAEGTAVICIEADPNSGDEPNLCVWRLI